MKNRGSSRRSPGRRFGKGTWRTTNIFNAAVACAMGVAQPFVICGNEPQNPITPGMPEPVSEYEISRLEGGLEPGLIQLVAGATVNTLFQVGFGLYVADWDPTLSAFVVLDPLNPTHVCDDRWVHLEWAQKVIPDDPLVSFSLYAAKDVNGVSTRSRQFRFTSGMRNIREGKALMASFNFIGVAGTVWNMTPFFRYHLRKIT
jgi:hypothetical protein